MESKCLLTLLQWQSSLQRQKDKATESGEARRGKITSGYGSQGWLLRDQGAMRYLTHVDGDEGRRGLVAAEEDLLGLGELLLGEEVLECTPPRRIRHHCLGPAAAAAAKTKSRAEL